MAKNFFDQFKKGSGEAPQYSTLAPVPASKTAKYVQSFDERAIMQEQPPTIDGGPRGSPKRPVLPVADGVPKRVREYDGMTNIRADNQILVREVPSSQKSGKDSRPNRLRIYRDQSGEDL